MPVSFASRSGMVLGDHRQHRDAAWLQSTFALGASGKKSKAT